MTDGEGGEVNLLNSSFKTSLRLLIGCGVN